MHQINNLLEKRPANSSPEGRIANPISREQAAALGDVFDRWRLNAGWNVWDDETMMAAIASWAATLDREGVPCNAYSELYERVLRRRADAIQSGRQVPPFGVELMLAEWCGEHGLKAERRQRDIDARRSLGSTAESVCEYCFGSGFRQIPPAKPEYPGVIKCYHEVYDDK